MRRCVPQPLADRDSASRHVCLEQVAQLRERGPAGVGLRLAVVVRLLVQILAADRAEARAVGPAQDIVRQREADQVPRPGGQVEPVLVEIRVAELFGLARTRRLVLPPREIELEQGIGEAAETRPVETRVEAELEHRAGARTRDRNLRRDRVRHRDVALAAELERLERELSLVVEPVPRPELERSQIEDGHWATTS